MSRAVPEGWQEIRLGDISEHITKGATPTTYGHGWVDEGVLFLRSESVKNGSFSLAGCSHITETAHGEMKRSKVRPGDILVAITGYIGSACIYPGPSEANINQHIARVRLESDVLSRYVMYFLNSEPQQREFDLIQTGQAYPQLSLKQIQDTVVPAPPPEELEHLAAILTSVDEVIEKTQAQIDKLKDLKRAMMQELLTRGIGHTEFQDSPVGRIPRAWRVERLETLGISVTSGSRGWARYYSREGPLFLRIGNLTREHINLRLSDVVRVQPPDTAEGRRTKVQTGDVLVSITADLGIMGVVPEGFGEAYVNQHIALVRVLQAPVNARWIGHFLASEAGQKQFRSANDPGAKAGLNLSSIRGLLVALPSTVEQNHIVAALDATDETARQKQLRVNSAKALKKAVMQDLLTGIVRVKVDA